MDKNVIAGVEPFNGFHYKSCYYHQLISGLACFGISKENILLNSFGKIKVNFGYVDSDRFSEKALEKRVGYRNIRCCLNKKKLIEYIDKGTPLIVGVDCFYFESRPDCYQIEHRAHFVLAYGYDLESNKVNVVDHNYVNSYHFIEKTISLDNLIYASDMLKRGELNRKYPCRRLKKLKTRNVFNIWDYIGEKQIIENRDNAIKNLEKLQELICSDSGKLKNNAMSICFYLEKVKSFYFAISRIYIFSGNEDKQKGMARLVSGYSNLVSLFWKMRAQSDYDYAIKRKEVIFRKIEDMKDCEKIVCEGLLEVIK